MSNQIYVGTRKGIFTIERQPNSSEWKISQVDFLGAPVPMLLQDPRDGALYAALDHEHFGPKLHRSDDGGQYWEECAVPAYPVEDANDSQSGNEGDAKKAPSLREIWCLETGGTDEPGLLWAGTIPGGLFRSTDRGASWQLIESLWNRPEREFWFGGGKDEAGIHSICVDPRDSKHITLGISCGGVWVTRDGGESWSCHADGMWAAYLPPENKNDPNLQDVHRLVNCRSSPDIFWNQHHNGIFRTTDDCGSWHEIKDVSPSSFGFATAVHPNDPDTGWFVPAVKDECRVPVDAKFVVTRTRDGGKSFDVLTDGLPQEHAYDIVFRHGLDVDDSGAHLVTGSSTGALWISDNDGDSWNCLSTHLPQIYCVRFAHSQ